MTERIRFANQLRGIAALSVACSHLIGVYWAIPEVVSAATFSPPQQVGALPKLFWLVAHPWLNLGPFGVAVFFLISGFVIPFSLGKHSGASFLLARLLRIYPTYMAALAIELLVLAIAAHGWGRPFAYGTQAIVSNGLLVYDLVGQPSIDLVNWTLSVELKFYLLMVLLAPWVRRCNAAVLLLAACAICGLNLLIWTGVIGDIGAAPSTLSYTFSSHSLCLIYMLLGTLFNFHLRGRLGTAGLLGGLLVLSGLFTATWTISVWWTQFPIVTANYGYALVLFGGLYAGRAWVPRIKLLDAMAAVSFPFYLIHSLVGYSVLKALMVGMGVGYYPALAATLGVLLAAAAFLHWMIERPSVRAGRWLAPKPLSDISLQSNLPNLDNPVAASASRP